MSAFTGSVQEEIKQWVKEIVSNPLEISQERYDCLHRRICDELKGLYPEKATSVERKFTYGIAQKWVNMTMKYIYVLQNLLQAVEPEHPFCKTFGRQIASLASVLHAPIDSYVLAEERKDGIIDQREIRNSIQAWSKLDCYDTYIRFQKALCQGLQRMHRENPDRFPLNLIDWESSARIERAEENLAKRFPEG